jgi:hypothetical protein
MHRFVVSGFSRAGARAEGMRAKGDCTVARWHEEARIVMAGADPAPSRLRTTDMNGQEGRASEDGFV